jgi:hypothetical protein
MPVAEAVNNSSQYADSTVTITGSLLVTEEVTALKGVSCVERINALKRGFTCAVSLIFPDCNRNRDACTSGLAEVLSEVRRMQSSRSGESTRSISLTGKLNVAQMVFVPYSPPTDLPGLPKGEYRPMGFGHMNAFPVQLVVTDGRVLRAENPSTLVEFACGEKFRFTARFTGVKGDDVEITTPYAVYRLHRSKELGGRKFVDDSGHIILVLASVRQASLTRGDVLVGGCLGRVPERILGGAEQ